MASETKKGKGYVYIFTNEAFPDYVKIGYTHDLNRRIRELSNTNVPKDYKKYASYETEDELSDTIVHKIIDTINPKLRVKQNREFFDMKPEVAYKVLEALAEFSHSSDSLRRYNDEGEETIPTNDKDIKSEKKKTPTERFSFIKCQIPIGSELTFEDDPSIKAYVADEHNVTYKGKTYTLTALTMELRNNPQAVRGTACWRYKGEILTDIRTRLEKEGLYK